jgi:O-antigen ligase
VSPARIRTFLAVSLLCLTTSLAFLGLLLSEQHTALRGVRDATTDAPLPYRPANRLGVNVSFEQYSRSERMQHFRAIADGGFAWIRQEVDPLPLVQSPEAGGWQLWDEVFEDSLAYPELKWIIVLVSQAPDAIAKGDAEGYDADPDTAAFLEGAGAFASRYGTYIDVYQIWDEPNLSSGWGGKPPRPITYYSLLHETSVVIRTSDPGARVLSAALAPTVEEGPANISEITYLEDLIQLGIAELVDGVAIKPYGFDDGPLNRTVSRETMNFSRAILTRELLEQYDLGHIPVWASGWGWNSLPPDWTGAPSIWGQVNADQQIDHSLAAMERVEHEWPWMAAMTITEWQPSAPHDDPVWGFSLTNQAGEPNTLYDALAGIASADVAGHGLFHPLNPYASFQGVWTFGPLGADIGWLETSDSEATFRFKGTDIALRIREDDYYAFLYATVDGVPANALPMDADGQAYLLLRSDSLALEENTVALARGLADTTHVLNIAADKGWDRWALAGFAVSAGDPATPYRAATAVAALTALISAIAAIQAFVLLRPSWPADKIEPILRHAKRPLPNLIASFLSSLILIIGLLLTFGEGTPAMFRRDATQLVLGGLISGGLLLLDPGFIVIVLAAFCLLVLIYNRPLTGLSLTLVWVPFYLFPIELFQYAVPVYELVLMITAGAVLLRLAVSAAARYRNHPIPEPMRWRPTPWRLLDTLLLAFTFLAIASLLWSDNQDPALTNLRVVILEPVLFYWIFRAQTDKHTASTELVWALVFTGSLVALVGLGQFLLGQTIITAELGTWRLAGVYGSPNNLAIFLSRTIPFSLAAFLITKSAFGRAFHLLILILQLATIVMTQSIGAILFAVPASAVVVITLWLADRRRSAAFFMVIASAGAIALFLVSRLPRFSNLLDLESGTTLFRIRLWQSALDMVSERPLTGYGLDQFLYAFRGTFVKPDAIWDGDLSHPHNLLLDTWLRLGVAGLLLVGGIIGLFFVNIARAFRLRGAFHQSVAVAVIGAAGSMAGLLAHGLVDQAIFVPDLALIFVTLLGVSANLSDWVRTSSVEDATGILLPDMVESV